MKNVGKWAGKILVKALLAFVLLALIGWAYTNVLGLSVVWGGILGLLLVLVLLVISVKLSPGKETVIDYLPTILVVMIVIGTIANLWANSPFTFVVEWSLVGFSVALASVFFSNAVVGKYMD